jgi:hypothetical protein
MASCWGKQQNITKNQNTNKTILASKERRESLETVHVYHAPSPEDPSPSGKPPKTFVIHQSQIGGDEEPSRAGERGALAGV